MFALAITAYQAYGESAGWKNYQGLPMPPWDELPPAIKQAWLDAADAVASVVRTEAAAAVGRVLVRDGA